MTALFLFSGCASSLRNVQVIRNVFYPEIPENPTLLGTDTEGDVFDHRAWTTLLSELVDDQGFVCYTKLAEREAQLNAYLDELATADIDRLSRYEQAALLINAYNAFTLRLMLDYPQVTSIRDIPAAKRWKDARWMLAGELQSLDAIEHELLRVHYADPRLHMVLVCASIGCPPLRAEAYQGSLLQAQLDDQSRRFLASERNARYDSNADTLWVSELLDWFRGDFGSSDADLQRFAQRYGPEAWRGQVREDSRIRYLKYDWNVNQSQAESCSPSLSQP